MTHLTSRLGNCYLPFKAGMSGHAGIGVIKLELCLHYQADVAAQITAPVARWFTTLEMESLNGTSFYAMRHTACRQDTMFFTCKLQNNSFVQGQDRPLAVNTSLCLMSVIDCRCAAAG